MISKRTHIIFSFINSIVLVAVLVILFFSFFQKKVETVYVDNIKLFNGFNMTKDLNQINGQKIDGQKRKLDSLYNIYTILRENNQTEKLMSLETQLRQEDEELKNMNEYFAREISESVWKRLNSYVNAYGVSNGFKIILGTQGSGNVMFAQKKMDITDELIIYANINYEGEK